MDVPVFFVDHFSGENVITLNEETSKHVVQVLRMKRAEKLQLTDGAGTLLTADILDDHKKKCTVAIRSRQLFPPKKQQISIAISLLKNAGRFEWFLEKATEIGVTEIIPLLCERTEKQHFRADRMQQIVISAMMQSQQFWLPVLQPPASFQSVVSASAYQNKLIAHCEEGSKPSIKKFSSDSSVQVLIGPEGDFSPDEIAFSLAQNYQPITLGNTRLRTETAGVIAAGLLCI